MAHVSYRVLVKWLLLTFDGNIDRPFVTGRIHEAQRSPTKFDVKVSFLQLKTERDSQSGNQWKRLQSITF